MRALPGFIKGFGSTVAAAWVCAAACAEDTIVIEGSTTVLPLAESFANYFMENNPGFTVTVSGGGSGNGAKAIMNGTAQVGDMSRFMKPKEFLACAQVGRMPTAHCVAYDGIAVVVNPKNPVSQLSMDQVRDIYSGTIRNWAEVGGPDMNIVLANRDNNSGTFDTFNSMVMAKKAEISTSAQTYTSNGQIKQVVETTVGAIGYVGLGFVDGVKALTVNGVSPTVETVKSGVYPIARPLFMVTDGYPAMGSPLFRFITLYLTEDGQDMVESHHFVPVTNY